MLREYIYCDYHALRIATFTERAGVQQVISRFFWVDCYIKLSAKNGAGVGVGNGAGLTHPNANAKTKVSKEIRTHDFAMHAMGNDAAMGHYNMHTVIRVN